MIRLEEFIADRSGVDQMGETVKVSDLREFMKGKVIADIEDVRKVLSMCGVIRQRVSDEMFEDCAGAAMRLCRTADKALQPSAPATQSSEESKV